MISVIDKKSTISKNLSPSLVTPLRNSLDGKLYSFGLGRQNMQPLHIDSIKEKGRKQLLPPGPGAYNLISRFGKGGKEITLAPRLSYDEV